MNINVACVTYFNRQLLSQFVRVLESIDFSVIFLFDWANIFWIATNGSSIWCMWIRLRAWTQKASTGTLDFVTCLCTSGSWYRKLQTLKNRVICHLAHLALIIKALLNWSMSSVFPLRCSSNRSFGCPVWSHTPWLIKHHKIFS